MSPARFRTLKLALKHPWNLCPDEARILQAELAKQVIAKDFLTDVKKIAGADVAYSKSDNFLVASAVILNSESLELVEQATSLRYNVKAYTPGLFSFRELPALIDAFSQLNSEPDLVVCDAHGIAHPRRFGLACHLGLCLDVPTIGCAKSILVGSANTPNIERGSISRIIDNGEVIGHSLRTQDNVRPVYVSVGHRISLETATTWIMRLTPRFRLPETTRMADYIARKKMRCAMDFD